MTTTPAGNTVSGLLQSRPDWFGFDLDLLAGGAALTRHITSPYTGGLRVSGEVIVQAEQAQIGKSECALQLAAMDQLDDSGIEDGSDSGEEQ